MLEALEAALVFVVLAEDPLFPYLPLLQRGIFYPLWVLKETENFYSLRRVVTLLKGRNNGTFLEGPLAQFLSFL